MRGPAGYHNWLLVTDSFLKGSHHSRSAGGHKAYIEVIELYYLFGCLHNSCACIDSGNMAIEFICNIVNFRNGSNIHIIGYYQTALGTFKHVSEVGNIFTILLYIILMKDREPGFHKCILVALGNRGIRRTSVRGGYLNLISHLIF